MSCGEPTSRELGDRPHGPDQGVRPARPAAAEAMRFARCAGAGPRSRAALTMAPSMSSRNCAASSAWSHGRPPPGEVGDDRLLVGPGGVAQRMGRIDELDHRSDGGAAPERGPGRSDPRGGPRELDRGRRGGGVLHGERDASAAALAGPARRGRAIAIVVAGSTSSLVLGTPLGTAVGAALGRRATLWTVAAPSAVASLVIVRRLPLLQGRYRAGCCPSGSRPPQQLLVALAPGAGSVPTGLKTS